jgi:hypothetical protein
MSNNNSEPKSITVEKFAEIITSELQVFVANTIKHQKDAPHEWAIEGKKPNFKQWFGDWNEQFSTSDLRLQENIDQI